MQRGAKIALGVLIAGGVVVAMVASEQSAHAKGADDEPPILPPLPGPQPGGVPIPPSGGIVVVPPIPGPGDSEHGPGESSLPPLVTPPNGGVIPLPGGGSFDPSNGQGPGSVPLPREVDPLGTTITLPGIGTYNPSTGNVFGPDGTIVGTFDPGTGVFTGSNGAPLQLPQLPGLPNSSSTPPQLPPVVQNGTPTVPPAQPLPIPIPPILDNYPLPNLTQPGNPSQPTSIAADTLTAIAAMLAQEKSNKWRKMPEPTLVTWQKNRKLTADGKFGTKSALTMADETGMIPIIRAWPSGSYPEGRWLGDYRAALRAKAASAPEPRKSQLLAAAEREKGQGWGTPEKPIISLIHLQEA